MALKNSLIAGMTDLIVLSILEKRGDCYVYDIFKYISTASDGYLNISQNTVYTSVYKLQDAGMITEYSKRVGKRRIRVYYTLEEKGVDYLKSLQEDYANIQKGMSALLAAIETAASETSEENKNIPSQTDLRSGAQTSEDFT